MLRAAALAAVGLLGLTACTASGSSAPHSPSASASAPTTTAAPQPTVTGTPSSLGPAELIVPVGRAAGRAGDRLHPGAAVLAGDAPAPAAAPIIPSAANPISGLRIVPCQVTQSQSAPKPCTELSPRPVRKTIAVVGDSVARQWLPALIPIASKRHWKVVVEAHSRCPFSATMTVNSGETKPYTACHSWGVAVLHQLLTSIKPDVVITTDLPVLGIPGQPQSTPATLAAIGRGMATYWRTLIAHGIAVAPIRESPEMHHDIPSCIKQSPSDLSACDEQADKAIRTAPPTVVAAGLVPAARLIDLNRLICQAPTCTPVVGNVLIYKDSHHLTDEYALTLAPYLERELLRVPALAP